MKAVCFHTFGGSEVLEYEEASMPIIGPHDVLIRLKAASLNHLDLWVRSGERERNILLPHIPGSDGAGIVDAIGNDVTDVKAGQRVLISPGLSCGTCPACIEGHENMCLSYRVLGTRENGTYAEFVALPSINVVLIPDGIEFSQAAAIPVVFITAWHMLVTLARLQPKETVLIHGAGSGVGSAAIQIAKMIGAHIITTAGNAEKLKKGKELGADDLINYREQDLVEEVRRITQKQGVDIVFEHVGGEVFEQSIKVLRRGGRLVTCGATTAYSAQIDLRYVYARHLSLLGSWMGWKKELLEVLKFFKEGKLHPVIDRVYPLADAAEAHRRMERREHFGKIVLKI